MTIRARPTAHHTRARTARPLGASSCGAVAPTGAASNWWRAIRAATGMLATSAALAVSGCGLGLVPRVTVSPHFSERASAICRTTNLAIEGLPVPYSTPASQARVARAAGRYLAAELRRLRRLTAPKRRRRAYATALGAVSALIALERHEVSAYSRNGLAQLEPLLARGQALTEIGDAAMNKLGLRDCAADPQPSAAA